MDAVTLLASVGWVNGSSVISVLSVSSGSVVGIVNSSYSVSVVIVVLVVLSVVIVVVFHGLTDLVVGIVGSVVVTSTRFTTQALCSQGRTVKVLPRVRGLLTQHIPFLRSNQYHLPRLDSRSRRFRVLKNALAFSFTISFVRPCTSQDSSKSLYSYDARTKDTSNSDKHETTMIRA